MRFIHVNMIYSVIKVLGLKYESETSFIEKKRYIYFFKYKYYTNIAKLNLAI